MCCSRSSLFRTGMRDELPSNSPEHLLGYSRSALHEISGVKILLLLGRLPIRLVVRRATAGPVEFIKSALRLHIWSLHQMALVVVASTTHCAQIRSPTLRFRALVAWRLAPAIPIILRRVPLHRGLLGHSHLVLQSVDLLLQFGNLRALFISIVTYSLFYFLLSQTRYDSLFRSI